MMQELGTPIPPSLLRMGPHPAHGSDRAWLSRWLEVSAETLRDLHAMRQEAEERVRRVLEDERTSQEVTWTKWQRNAPAENDVTRVLTKLRSSPDLELEHIEEEVLGVTERRNTSGKETASPHIPELQFSPGRGQRPRDPKYSRVASCQVQELAQELQHKMIIGENTGKVKAAGSIERMDHGYRAERIHSRDHGCRVEKMNGMDYGCRVEKMDGMDYSCRVEKMDGMDHGCRVEKMDRMDHGCRAERIRSRDHGCRAESCQNTRWGSVEGTYLSAQEKPHTEPTELPLLCRIGSGSLPPRLKLGSSGVSSEILFTRRFSGNCLSSHSSGFYESSDLDSILSSCSSLCSEFSCHTSTSMTSPHQNLITRPRSIDYTNERRKELQKGRVQTRRPISAGALESFSLSSSSRYDINQYDRTTCDYTYFSTPPLCAIQLHRKAERYICKLALKYRCKPGVNNPLPDLGPPAPRTPVPSYLYSECHNSCPPSPKMNSLSSSLEDIRKTPKGSWGRFFSRVRLKKDSRIAASELNLQHCINSPQKSLRSPSLADGQLVRTKSFRDLLSIKPFKRSQRGLNKIW
ncbi:uncharacterized protein [Pyxicephalus adspersus]|uniref:uncharacterized protein n=1 Tax=Pyxicephalus adspersus TaxID=30357 RepID=UPI003B58D038